MAKYKHILIIFLGLCSFIAKSQVDQPNNPIYSQYWINGLATNPAYTGSRESFSNTLLYRNQWAGFDGAPETVTYSGHTPLKDQKNNVGFFFMNDEIGVTTYTDFYANYAFRFKLGKGKISFGLSGGLTLLDESYTDIITAPGETGGDVFSEIESDKFYNFGVGTYYYTDKYFVGLSVPKLLHGDFDILLTAGYLYEVNSNVKLKPSFLFAYKTDNNFYFDAGLNIIFYDALWTGFSYKYNKQFTAIVEYQITDQLRAGVAYDFSSGDLASYNSGTLELVLRYDFNHKIRGAVSPKFF